MSARTKKLRGFPSRIMGLENEYGLLVKGPNQHNAVAVVCQQVRHWLENGGCIYPDVGHIETCTPEVQSGYEALVYDRALERLIRQRLYGLLDAGVGDIHLLKNNIGLDWVDGKPVETTFGCHENYLLGTKTAVLQLIQVLAPFFATRQLFAGAGSVVRDENGSWHFELSQRARHTKQLSYSAATSNRGFIKATSETLGDPEQHQRLQVVLGDANILWEPAAYKLDLTSLMLLMFENNALPVVVLADSSVKVLHRVAREGPGTPLELANGSWVTALDIQARYLAAATAFVQRWKLARVWPAVRYWQDVVMAFETGDEAALYGRVDWVTKRQRLHRVEERLGKLSWEQAFRRDLAYHDLTQPLPNLPDQLRRSTDPADLEEAVTWALMKPPPGRAAIRSALIRLAQAHGVRIGVDWVHVKLYYGESDKPVNVIALLDPYAQDQLVLEMATEFLAEQRAA